MPPRARRHALASLIVLRPRGVPRSAQAFAHADLSAFAEPFERHEHPPPSVETPVDTPRRASRTAVGPRGSRATTRSPANLHQVGSAPREQRGPAAPEAHAPFCDVFDWHCPATVAPPQRRDPPPSSCVSVPRRSYRSAPTPVAVASEVSLFFFAHRCRRRAAARQCRPPASRPPPPPSTSPQPVFQAGRSGRRRAASEARPCRRRDLWSRTPASRSPGFAARRAAGRPPPACGEKPHRESATEARTTPRQPRPPTKRRRFLFVSQRQSHHRRHRGGAVALRLPAVRWRVACRRVHRPDGRHR
jgi:hypothetical protein